MREKLLNIIYEFSEKLTQEERNQYIPKLRDYLVPYIIENKSNSFDIGDLFRDEFTKSDVINATIYYITNNENIESLSAIDNYLISINRLFEEFIFKKYSNPNLVKYKPFSQFYDEIQNLLIKEGIKLKSRETNPAINLEQYKFIIKYLQEHNDSREYKLGEKNKSSDTKSNQVSIIIKLFLLYGFSGNKIANMKISDYCLERKTLRIDYKRVMTRSIYIELPYTLTKEIDSYLELRKQYKCLDSDLLFVTGKNNKIKSGFTDDILRSIKEDYLKINEGILDKNQFTPTGLQKYAIIQMIKHKMNQSVIMDFSGQQYDIYNDCQNEVNRLEELDRNRYINHVLRGISTYDEI